MPRTTRAHYLIAYDVAEDKCRTKLSELLLNYGDRVQYSVFEADLSPKDVQEILTKASNLITDQDSLRIYPLCANCLAGIKSLGTEMPGIPAGFVIV